MIKTAHINLLENATVSLAAGTQDSAYPLYRLHDRNIGRPFRITSAETLEVLMDQGAAGSSYTSVDTLIIPAGHNLEGMTLDIRYSDDDASYSDATAQWVAQDGEIVKSWPPLARRYWKFIVTLPSSAPSIPEIFLTVSYEWERMPARPAGPMEDVLNIASAFTSGGRKRFLKNGPPRRRRTYVVPRCPASMRDEVLGLWQTHGEGKPFWLLDHEGQWIYGSLEAGLDMAEVGSDVYSFGFVFMEVLP